MLGTCQMSERKSRKVKIDHIPHCFKGLLPLTAAFRSEFMF